jgi:PD-(D/E)XK nuclease superfamily
MNMEAGFQLSQSSLQDFVECRRRFELRYLRRLAWPALQSEPALEFERYIQQGERFHRMVQQHLLGVPEARLSAMALEADLKRWWENYLHFSQSPDGLGALSQAWRQPETSLSAPLGDLRLVAKYDLIVINPEPRALIFDWKTARKRPQRKWLAERLQTRLYPYLLLQAGASLNKGKPFEPEQVEMVYWFAEFPDQSERFAYSQAAYQSDQAYIAELVDTIQGLGQFPLTSNEKRCAFCAYRSLCERGVRAGGMEAQEEAEAGDELELRLDFDQVQEIEF